MLKLFRRSAWSRRRKAYCSIPFTPARPWRDLSICAEEAISGQRRTWCSCTPEVRRRFSRIVRGFWNTSTAGLSQKSEHAMFAATPAQPSARLFARIFSFSSDKGSHRRYVVPPDQLVQPAHIGILDLLPVVKVGIELLAQLVIDIVEGLAWCAVSRSGEHE